MSFAMVGNLHFHHAWVTLDGINAVDVTLRIPEEAQFFGIAFSLSGLREQILSVRQGRAPMLDAVYPLEALEALIEKAGISRFGAGDAADALSTPWI
ncbi:hypothetical protein [Bradyrhizobium sp. 25ACV]